MHVCMYIFMCAHKFFDEQPTEQADCLVATVWTSMTTHNLLLRLLNSSSTANHNPLLWVLTLHFYGYPKSTSTATHIPLIWLLTLHFYDYSQSTSTATQFQFYGYPQFTSMDTHITLLRLPKIHFYGYSHSIPMATHITLL